MDSFKKHFARFSSLLRRRGRTVHEAEDLVQEAYVRLLAYIEQGERVLEPEAFLTRTVLNLEIDESRRACNRLADRRSVLDLVLLDETPGLEEQLANDQYVEQVRRTLDEAVGEKTRRAFFLHCLDGMTYAEIGSQLNLSGRSIERHIAKAVAILSLAKRPWP